MYSLAFIDIVDKTTSQSTLYMLVALSALLILAGTIFNMYSLVILSMQPAFSAPIVTSGVSPVHMIAGVGIITVMVIYLLYKESKEQTGANIGSETAADRGPVEHG